MFEANRSARGWLLAGMVSAALGGCAASGGEAPVATAPAEPARPCDAAPAKRHVGQKASEAVGAAILKESGARTLRWGPPRSAWTMDYRPDRVNVRYDDAMIITDVLCG